MSNWHPIYPRKGAGWGARGYVAIFLDYSLLTCQELTVNLILILLHVLILGR